MLFKEFQAVTHSRNRASLRPSANFGVGEHNICKNEFELFVETNKIMEGSTETPYIRS
jgi:hypothetical protein